MQRGVFGRLEDGEKVEYVELAGGGLSARILTWGCVVQDLRMDGHDHPLVLGCSRFDPYPAHTPYFGATAGRCANRIRDGRFSLDGRQIQLDRNFLGKHHLHGGRQSLGRRNWNIVETGTDFVELAIEDEDGRMGYPGNCSLRARFELTPETCLAIGYTAVTDAPTLVNLAHHSYFNLDGGPDILDHELQVAADFYLPVDPELIPENGPCPVEGTAFDFRAMRPIRTGTANGQPGYDHNFCLSPARTACRQVATLQSRRSGIAMSVSTTEPGLQVYDGRNIAVPADGLEGTGYGAHAGICLEPQVWPDSPNRPGFPQAVLRPGETYRQDTVYGFRRRTA